MDGFFLPTAKVTSCPSDRKQLNMLVKHSPTLRQNTMKKRVVYCISNVHPQRWLALSLIAEDLTLYLKILLLFIEHEQLEIQQKKTKGDNRVNGGSKEDRTQRASKQREFRTVWPGVSACAPSRYTKSEQDLNLATSGRERMISLKVKNITDRFSDPFLKGLPWILQLR